MEFRSQKTTGAAFVMAVCLIPSALAQRELRYDVRHDRWGKDDNGTLVIDERGIAYQEVSKKKNKQPDQLQHDKWAYQDIQQLYIAPNKLTVVTYIDRKWRFGADKEYQFELRSGNFNEAYMLLKDRLDQRFVAAIADEKAKMLWEIPVKLLGTITGSEGVLQVGPDRLVYKTDRKDQSRTWRYRDIENISTSSPFQLTVTTFERAKTHYGSLKGFNFQLKQPLEEKRYNLLWRRLNQSKGLQLLTSVEQKDTEN